MSLTQCTNPRPDVLESRLIARARAKSNDMKILLAIARLFLLITIPLFAQSISGSPEEFAEAARWAAAKFEGKADTQLAAGYLTVHLKSGQVGKNQVSTRG